MTGCRVGAKNTLDLNYLFLAERLGARVEPETEAVAVRPRRAGGYTVEAVFSSGERELEREYSADRIVFAAGVLGTVALLLRMRDDERGLPRLSACLGEGVRTNHESLAGVIDPHPTRDFSQGLAITSILQTDEHSHLEPVRYAPGSGFFRLLALPHAPGSTALSRLGAALRQISTQPRRWTRALLVPDFARHSQILLYMRALNETLRLELGANLWTGFRSGLVTRLQDRENGPRAFMPEATDLLQRFAREVDGVPLSLLTETLNGVPTTAHLLGGCCMGETPASGVIDHDHRVFGYDGLFVIDGSSVSANPGVNPSLTIAALAERAISRIPCA
jgi:cholesterol oxidase